MTTRELIQAEIASIPEQDLDELYDLVRQFTEAKVPPKKGILAKLRGVRIEAPADFAANLDHYLSGEKRVGEDVP